MINEEFDSDLVYKEKNLRTKLNLMKDVSIVFGIVSVILIDSFLKRDKNYYLQVLLEAYKYIANEKDKKIYQ